MWLFWTLSNWLVTSKKKITLNRSILINIRTKISVSPSFTALGGTAVNITIQQLFELYIVIKRNVQLSTKCAALKQIFLSAFQVVDVTFSDTRFVHWWEYAHVCVCAGSHQCRTLPCTIQRTEKRTTM